MQSSEVSRKTSRIKVIDTALWRYYSHKETEYYNDDKVGKFEEFCEVNGFDSDDVVEELNMDPFECSLVDFDEEFPASSSGQEKTMEIYVIITHCYEDKNAFMKSGQLPYHKNPLQRENKISRNAIYVDRQKLLKIYNELGNFIHSIVKLGYKEREIIDAINSVHKNIIDEKNYKYDDILLNTQQEIDQIIEFLERNYERKCGDTHHELVSFPDCQQKEEYNTIYDENDDIFKLHANDDDDDDAYDDNTIFVSESKEYVFETLNVRKLVGDADILKLTVLKDLLLGQNGAIIGKKTVILSVGGNLTINGGEIIGGDTVMMNVRGSLTVKHGNICAVDGDTDCNIYIKCGSLSVDGTSCIRTSSKPITEIYDRSLAIPDDKKKSLYGNVYIEIAKNAEINGVIQSGDIYVKCDNDIIFQSDKFTVNGLIASRNNLQFIAGNKLIIHEGALWETKVRNEMKWHYKILNIIPIPNCIESVLSDQLKIVYKIENIINSLTKFGYQKLDIFEAINNRYNEEWDETNYKRVPIENCQSDMDSIIKYIENCNKKETSESFNNFALDMDMLIIGYFKSDTTSNIIENNNDNDNSDDKLLNILQEMDQILEEEDNTIYDQNDDDNKIFVSDSKEFGKLYKDIIRLISQHLMIKFDFKKKITKGTHGYMHNIDYIDFERLLYLWNIDQFTSIHINVDDNINTSWISENDTTSRAHGNFAVKSNGLLWIKCKSFKLSTGIIEHKGGIYIEAENDVIIYGSKIKSDFIEIKYGNNLILEGSTMNACNIRICGGNSVNIKNSYDCTTYINCDQFVLMSSNQYRLTVEIEESVIDKFVVKTEKQLRFNKLNIIKDKYVKDEAKKLLRKLSQLARYNL